ncbi:MAG: alkaline phosphatase family protein [Planctomycetaceae bacterium]|nr:alkaline phosphatase family protein [Planctomycetaceae bacterium]
MNQRLIIIMLDGFGWDYWEQSEMPNLKAMAAQGFVKKGEAVFPTLTNANNVSIACGCAPIHHGIVANCQFDTTAKTLAYVESADALHTQTIFHKAAAHRITGALFTAKSKTMSILGDGATVGLSPSGRNDLVGETSHRPPSVYSAEINYWLFESLFPALNKRKDIGLYYIHTTDFPMHFWGPEERESLDHMRKIDALIGEAVKLAPDAAFLVTADHGMGKKRQCVNLDKICKKNGAALERTVSPVANRLMAHHGGYGGVSYIYLKDRNDGDAVQSILQAIGGVEDVLHGYEAAQRFELPAELLGDLVVLADRHTVFGNSDDEFEDLPRDYRGHGSLHEIEVPLIAYNIKGGFERFSQARKNYHLTQLLFNQPGS